MSEGERQRDRERDYQQSFGYSGMAVEERTYRKREKDGVDEALSSFRMKIIRYFRSMKKLCSFLSHS